MAASFTFYDSFREYMGDGTIDLDGHTFKVMLTTSSYTPSASTHSVKADVTNEVSSTNTGYTTGGATLASVTWTRSSGTVTFDAADVTWTAGSAGLTARYAVIYSDTATNDELVGYVLLDTTPADVSVTSGNTLTIQWNASGIFTLSTP